MQAIETKYFGPSNVKGSRIKATAAAGSITVGYDHALNLEANHRQAAQMLRDKFGWANDLEGGTIANGNIVWVLRDR